MIIVAFCIVLFTGGFRYAVLIFVVVIVIVVIITGGKIGGVADYRLNKCMQIWTAEGKHELVCEDHFA